MSFFCRGMALEKRKYESAFNVFSHVNGLDVTRTNPHVYFGVHINYLEPTPAYILGY